MLFSKEETRDIIVAVVVLTIIFAYPNFKILFYSFISIITAFLFHELAHRWSARKFGCAAFFKAWPVGLVIGLVLMFTGFKVFLPGAVVIYPFRFGRWKFKVSHITIKEIGIIASSGPIINLVFGAVFSLFSGEFFNLLVFINSWFAFFNLLPINPLDGAKVFTWKPWFWFLLIITSIILASPYLFR